MKVSLLLLQLLLASGSFAQTALKWDADTTYYFHEGCFAPPIDTIVFTLSNAAEEPAVLRSIATSSYRWILVQPSMEDSLTLQPGEAFSVQIAHTGTFPLHRTRDFVILTDGNGQKDTAIIDTDVIYSMVAGLTDTVAIDPVEVGLQTTVPISIFVNGNYDFILSEFSVVHGDQIRFEGISAGDTLPVKQQSRGYMTYTPTQAGDDTVRISFKGMHCDSLYNTTFLFRAVDRHRPYPFWTKSEYGFNAPCSDSVGVRITMHSTDDLPVRIDSVRIQGAEWMYRVVRSEPPGRINDFMINPGEEISYYVTFDPRQRGWPAFESALRIYSTTGNDSVRLFGRVLAPQLEISNEVYPNVVYVDSPQYYQHRIKNTGELPFTLDEVLHSESGNINLQLVFPTVGTVLLPGDSLDLIYSISPTRTGIWQGYLSLVNEFCDTLHLDFEYHVRRKSSISDASASEAPLATMTNGELIFSSEATFTKYRIYNSAGQLCYDDTAPASKRLSVGMLSPGAYTLVTSGGGQIQRFRFIVKQ